MQVQYLVSLMMWQRHLALTGFDQGSFPPSCFVVELGEGAGFEGSLIEEDVLIGNEDLTIVKVGDEHLLA